MGVPRPDPDLAGLRSVYAAWCGAVPFDNTLKLIHASEGRDGSLPGSTAEAFFGDWLERGTGGTCWAGNGALHDLLSALGFEVHRAIATMLPRPDVVGPNHGSVVVTIDGARWIADASILSGEPIAIRPEGEEDASEPLPRLSWRGAKPAVLWRMLMAPDGFPCRIERIGADAEEWDALHQRTAAWSPFNYQLSVRLLRGDASIGAASGQRFSFEPDGALEAAPLIAEERARFLVEEIGIAEEVALRAPPDRPVPPRP
jgi:N-hydroxyarylamine O-acetyltransferase